MRNGSSTCTNTWPGPKVSANVKTYKHSPKQSPYPVYFGLKVSMAQEKQQSRELSLYGRCSELTSCSYRTLLDLQALDALQTPYEPFRVISYFCSARGTKRPDCETVIRSLIRKLSWKSDYSVSESARSLYIKCTKGLKNDLSTKDWQRALIDVIQEYGKTARIVFLVDALDELADIEQWVDLLRCTREVTNECHNVYLIYTSHIQVVVDDYFDKSILLQYEVKQSDTKKDMENFIDKEIAFRSLDPGSRSSIFCT
ncbi:hypothetical protein IG631_05648 [Alternaria alternata]|nr:hypothetical protein IG631_05648 [Alternaria alternata]